MIDGRISFEAAGKEVALGGWTVEVDGGRIGIEHGIEEVKENRTPNGVTFDYRARMKDGRDVTVRSAMTIRDDVATVSWSMPGTTRTPQGSPRFTRIALNAWDHAPKRIYAGMGNVLTEPKEFSLRAGGFYLSTRHVGADFAEGPSVVVATSVMPDTLDVNAEKNVFSLRSHNDVAYTFVVSTNAFAAAARFASVAGYARSAGWRRLAGRTVLDQWSGDYGRAADDLERVAGYGVTNAVFVKHDWQRWGYDFRLPDIYPPRGDFSAFRRMVRAAQAHGTDFCPHDNYVDFYRDAEGYSDDLVTRDGDGKPKKAWFNRSRNAQSYQWNPLAFGPWLDRNMRLMRDGFAPDGLFIDVFTAAAPRDFVDKDGTFFPAIRCATAWGKAFDRAREQLGRKEGPMISEAGHDALIGHVDAGEADHYSGLQWRIGDEKAFGDSVRVPWHDIVSHGCMILCGGGLGHRYRGDGDARVHGDGSDDYLATTVIGGRNPMCEGPCNRRAVLTHWLVHDVLEPIARSPFMSFSFEDDNPRRQHSVFGAGEVWVNRADGDSWRVGKRVLPRDGFLVRSTAGEAGVVRIGSRRAAYARTPGRFFVDARPPTMDGVRDCLRVTLGEGRKEGSVYRIGISCDREALADGLKMFAHVIVAPEGRGSDGPIIRQARKIQLGKNGCIEIDMGADVATGDVRHEVLIGAYSPQSGHRELVRLMPANYVGDRGKRLSIGFLDEKGWTPPPERTPEPVPAELELNAAREIVDFAAVRTDGTFLLDYRNPGEWRIRVPPDALAFRAELALNRLGAAGRRVSSVTGVESWEQKGDVLSLKFSPEASQAVVFINQSRRK